jgi:hypothetical protein
MSSRLEKAKSLYQNLLHHATEIVQDEITMSPHRSSSPTRFQPSSSYIHGPSSSTYDYEDKRPTHVKSSNRNQFDFGSSGVAKSEANSDVIVTLQSEIERLREKLANVLAAADYTYEQQQLEQVVIILNFIDFV